MNVKVKCAFEPDDPPEGRLYQGYTALYGRARIDLSAHKLILDIDGILS